MTIIEPKCLKCKHYNRLKNETLNCKAFEDIPEEILNGENDHTKPLSNQKNEIVFEPIENAEID